jgi:hypothetical protein
MLAMRRLRGGEGVSRKLARSSALLAMLCSLLILLSSGSSMAAIYWNDGKSIGRVNSDGASPERDFIPLPLSDGGKLCGGVAVNDTYIYWSQPGLHAIGRANLDGSNPIYAFVPGAGEPCGIAINDSHIFWADSTSNTIKRANLDGSSVQSFITGEFWTTMVELHDSHIYWVSVESWINRATLAGTEYVQPMVDGDGQGGLAINDQYIYWADLTDGIGRARLDGNEYIPDFISGLGKPCDVVIQGSQLYWSDIPIASEGAIGRVNLDKTGFEPKFLSGVEPCGLAADHVGYQPRALPPSQFAFGRIKHAEFRPATQFAVLVPDRGAYSMDVAKAVDWIKASSDPYKNRFLGSGKFWFSIWPRDTRAGHRLERKIKRRGNARIWVSFHYTADGKSETTKRKRISIQRGQTPKQVR